MRKRYLAPILCAAICTGCVEFLEPDLPEAGAPAVMQANIRLSSDGVLHFRGDLAPALSFDGFQRDVPNDTVTVMGVRIPSDTVLPNNTRRYAYDEPIANPFTRPITFTAPLVDEVFATPPSVSWDNFRRVDGDTVAWQPGTELVLRIARVPGSEPRPQISQWSVDLVSTEGNFRIGATGVPPETIRIPPYYMPASANGRVTAVFTYFQIASFRPAPGDYVLTLGADLQLQWIVRDVSRP